MINPNTPFHHYSTGTVRPDPYNPFHHRSTGTVDCVPTRLELENFSQVFKWVNEISDQDISPSFYVRHQKALGLFYKHVQEKGNYQPDPLFVKEILDLISKGRFNPDELQIIETVFYFTSTLVDDPDPSLSEISQMEETSKKGGRYFTYEGASFSGNKHERASLHFSES